jgi:tetratricopeptide (TPR) repeat protein
VLHRLNLLPLLVLLSLGSLAQPAVSQVAATRTLSLEPEQLQNKGLALVKEAQYFTRFQQFEVALAKVKLATQLVPDSAQAWAILGALSLNQDQLDPGIQALERSLALDAKNPGVHFSLGSAYFRKGRYPDAAKVLEAGLKLQPDVPEALFDLGNTYYRLKDYPSAVSRYQKAFNQNKQFWPAINNVGLVQYELGNIDAAIENWKAAIALDDSSGEPKLALAVALYTKGEQQAGLDLAETALKLDNRYGDVDYLKENLWGDRLITDTQILLATPKIQETLAQLKTTAGGVE